MSESREHYSWDGLADELKQALIDFMAVNDLVESSFVGVTAQLQVFGRIGMTSAATIYNKSMNSFLDRPTTNKDMKDKKKSLFHDFPEELKIAAIMCAVQEAPATRQSKTDSMNVHHNAKQDRDNLEKREGLDKAADEFIQCLIYRQMWYYNKHWKISGEVDK